MNAEDYQKVKEIFNSVLEIEPDGRNAFLDEKCDEPLRDEVERLLQSYDSEYLEQPAVGNMAGELIGDGLKTGQKIGHYTILEKIGSGGMGEVYLAEDGKLGRRVAIKLLPDMFTKDDDRLRRFDQEARTASALNHPNILTIHEIGETDGTKYIATEYIDGETLRQKLNRERLTVAEAIEIAVQTASALAAAHEAGIIHRDIKPENIMLRRDNLVKVLDFGLAKLVEPKEVTISQDAPTERHFRTAPGIIMGTVQYMSPEQTRGHATDARTDIWSLGVVVYEMLAGQPPFKGENSADLIAEIVKTHPAPLARSVSDVPERLDEIVAKTLEKNPDERYQTAKDLLIDLKRLKRKLDLKKEMERSSPRLSEKIVNGAGTVTDPNRKPLESLSGTQYVLAGIKLHRGTAIWIIALIAALLLTSAYLARKFWRITSPNEARFSYANKINLAAKAIEASNLPLAKQYLDETKPKSGEKDLRGFEWGYLSRLHAENVASQPITLEHTSVDSVAFSPDGKTMASAGMDNVARLWNVSTGEQVMMLAGHTGWLVSVTFSPDGKTLATGAFDKTARLWDIASGRELFTIPSEGGVITGLTFLADGKTLAGDDDGNIKFWNAATGVERTEYLKTHEAHNPFALSGDGKLFAARARNEDRSALIWEIASGRKLLELRGHTGLITDLKFSPDSKTLLTGSTDGTAKLWDLKSGNELRTSKGHSDEIWDVAFSPDGKIIATGSKDDTIKLWDTETGHEIATLRGHADNVRALAFSPDGRKLASGSENTASRIWNVPQSVPRGVLRGHAKGVGSLTFSPDSKTIASASEDNTAKLWDVDTERERLTLSGHAGEISSPAFSRDGLTLATAGEDGKIKLWDVVTGRERLSFDSPKPATALKFSLDDKLLASAHWFQDDEVRLWDTSNGTLVCSADAGGGVWNVEFLNDGKQFVTSTGAIRFWETASCREISTFQGEPDTEYFLSQTPNGKLFAAQIINNERSLKLVDIESGKELVTFSGHETKLASADFSPDGNRLVTSDEAGLVKIWDVATGQELLSLKAKAGEVNQMKFSPDGKIIATGGSDGTIKLWRATAN